MILHTRATASNQKNRNVFASTFYSTQKSAKATNNKSARQEQQQTKIMYAKNLINNDGIQAGEKRNIDKLYSQFCTQQ